MKTIKVREAMTPAPVTVTPETPVTDVAKVMIDKNVGGLPVVDAEGDLVGIVTESDLIVHDTDVPLPSFVHFLDSYIFVPGSVQRFEDKFRKAVGNTAGDVMTDEVVTVDADDSAEDVATMMSRKKMKRFPVVEGGSLVGIITMADIVKLISRDVPVEG
ncbi:MAG TPA: CBS domain-containing protein [Candidatus Methylomirabilis sp.]|jgi:CBS domain-containing protein